MRRIFWLALFLPLVGGCGGYYILTVPDQLASSKGDMVPVLRLQRNDWFVLALPARGQPMQFRLYPTSDTRRKAPGEGPLRACATDKSGYAGVQFAMADAPVSGKPGLYYLKVNLQDYQGEELSAAVSAFVWDPQKPVVAVEMSALPLGAWSEQSDAATALKKIARTANILYLTRHERRVQDQAHMDLAAGGYPDGPVLLWQRERWHIVRDGRFNLPRVEVETRLVSQLPKLAEDFPKFEYGICHSGLAAKAIVDAGLKCVVVGNAWLTGSQLTHRQSWAELAAQGLPDVSEDRRTSTTHSSEPTESP